MLGLAEADPTAECMGFPPAVGSGETVQEMPVAQHGLTTAETGHRLKDVGVGVRSPIQHRDGFRDVGRVDDVARCHLDHGRRLRRHLYTLRFYEAEGLIPDPDRTPAGYRTYPKRAADRVRFIKDAQAAGFTLAQIREIPSIRDGGQPPCEHVTDLVRERLTDVDARLRELRGIRRQLQEVAARANALDPANCGDYCALTHPH